MSVVLFYLRQDTFQCRGASPRCATRRDATTMLIPNEREQGSCVRLCRGIRVSHDSVAHTAGRETVVRRCT